GGGPATTCGLEQPTSKSKATAERADKARALERSADMRAPHCTGRGGERNSGKSVPRAPARVKVRALFSPEGPHDAHLRADRCLAARRFRRRRRARSDGRDRSSRWRTWPL